MLNRKQGVEWCKGSLGYYLYDEDKVRAYFSPATNKFVRQFDGEPQSGTVVDLPLHMDLHQAKYYIEILYYEFLGYDANGDFWFEEED